MAKTRDAGVQHGDFELWYLFILMNGSFCKSRRRKVMAYITGKLERMVAVCTGSIIPDLR